MTKFILKSGSFETGKKRVATFKDLVDVTLSSDGASFETVAEFADKESGLKALSDLVNSVYEISGRIGALLCGKVYFLCEEEYEDGEFFQELGCDAAEKWDSTEAEIFGNDN